MTLNTYFTAQNVSMMVMLGMMRMCSRRNRV